MKIKDDSIIFQAVIRPWGVWLSVSVWLALTGGLFGTVARQMPLGWLFAALLSLMPLWLVVSSPTTILQIDQLARRLTLQKKHWWGSSILCQSRLDEIQEALFEERAGRKGGTYYDVKLVFRDGKALSVLPYASNQARYEKKEFAARINAVLHKRPSCRVPPIG